VRVVTGQWAVADASDLAPGMPGLMQSAQGGASVFNLCFVECPPFEDGAIDVRFKPVAGVVDQGGGLVWRARDGANYYVGRWNPLEANLRVYKVVAGERVQLGSADVEPTPGWHHLRVEVDGPRMRLLLDGKERLAIEDDTFGDAGHVGLWTKSDAQTVFADLLVLTRS
jgi:hypothetical protein